MKHTLAIQAAWQLAYFSFKPRDRSHSISNNVSHLMSSRIAPSSLLRMRFRRSASSFAMALSTCFITPAMRFANQITFTLLVCFFCVCVCVCSAIYNSMSNLKPKTRIPERKKKQLFVHLNTDPSFSLICQILPCTCLQGCYIQQQMYVCVYVYMYALGIMLY